MPTAPRLGVAVVAPVFDTNHEFNRGKNGLPVWSQFLTTHGTNGNSIDPTIPALASQRADWLETVLSAYRTGARKSSAMSAMSSQLTEADIKEVAAYYSRQPARPVAYVIVPK